MGEFKLAWNFELSATANVWLMSSSPAKARSLTETLAKKGLGKIRTFQSPDELTRGLESAFGKTGETPVAILCDAERDTKTTLAFLKDLRVNPRSPNLPVIPILKADEWDRAGPSLHAYGVTNALVVPFTPEELVSVLSKQVHNFQRNGVEKVIQEARASFRKGDFAAARELFEQARAVRKSMPTEVGLANALVSEGNAQEARKIATEALQLDGDSFDLQLLGLAALVNLRMHTDRTHELIVKTTKQIFAMCYFEDRALRLFGTLSPRVESVVRAYEQLPEEFARWPVLQFETAKTLFGAERDEQAVSAAMDAYGRGLRRPELLNLLGVLHRRRGARKEAYFFYEEALKAWPDDHRLHFNAGLCLEELGRAEDARAAYGECLRIAPTFAKAHERLAAMGTARRAS